MPGQNSTSWRILLVDDDEEDYILTRALLRGIGGLDERNVQLEWVHTYEAGEAALQSNLYDVVLIDYDLGSRTGLEFIREIVGRDYPAPLILFTGRGNFEVHFEAMQAGATMYLTKQEATPLLMARFLEYAIQRKRDQAELDRRNQERAEILESIQDGFFSVDRSWCFRYINQRAAQTGGLSPDQMIGKNLWKMYPKLLGTTFETNYRIAMDERRPVQFETAGLYSKTFYNISVYPSSEGISIFWQDISQRKQLEAERHSVALFPEENPNPVMRLSIDGALIYANSCSRTLLQSWKSPHPSGLPYVIVSAVQKAFLRGMIQQIEIDCDRKTYSFVIAPILDRQYVNLYGVDITERKQMEAALVASEERYRVAIENLLDAFTIFTAVRDEAGEISDFRVEYVNEAACAVAGRRREELVGQRLFSLYPAGRDSEIVRGLREAAMSKQPIVFENFPAHIPFIRPDRPTYMDIRIAPLGDGFTISWRDVTDRTQAEQALHESEARFRVMADGTPLIIWVTDRDGRIEFVNQAYCDFFDVTAEQVQVAGWQPLVHPDDQAGYVGAFIDCHQGRQKYHAEGRVRRGDGEWRWVESFGQPRFSPAGEYLGMAGSSVDITGRKQAEEQAKQAAK